jgi:hypothetical protein
MQRRLLLAFVWLGALFLLGLTRTGWQLLRLLTSSARRFLLLGGLVLALKTTDLSALQLSPQIEMPSHPVMAAGSAIGALLVLIQGFTSPWSRRVRHGLSGE